MAIPLYALPYGLRDVKLVPMAADGTLGTAVDLPAARTLSFAETEDSIELRGDDVVIAGRGTGATVNWSLESGGISLEAYAVLAGGAITTSGVTPNIKKTYAKLGTDSRPSFKIEGQVISESGGDLHAVIYKAKAVGDIGGDFQDASFFLLGTSGNGIPNAAGKTYDFVHNETAAAIS